MINRKLDKVAKPEFEYCISGLNHTFFTFTDYAKENPELQSAFAELVKQVRGAYNHDISVLWNAFLEKPIGKGLTNRGMRNMFKYIYADSGGLQIVTLGKELNDENKTKVYEMQSKYSDLGMSFDEIPIVLTGEKSSRVSTTDRFFDTKNFKEFAIKSGHNLRDQIRYFKDHNSACRPFLIIQGNCMETYQQWLDWVLKEVPFEDWKYIGGLSSGVAALGMGKFENIERYGILAQLQGPPSILKHIHILGVGGINRIIPLLALHKNGFFPHTDNISYDSTTHSCSMTMGLYYLRNSYTSSEFRGVSTAPVERLKNKIIDEMVELVDLDKFDMDRNFVYSALFDGATDFNKKTKGTNRAKYQKHLARFISVIVQVLNFSEYVERLHNSRDVFLDYVSSSTSDIRQLSHLIDIKDVSTYNMWLKEAKRSMSSSRVGIVGNMTPNLEEFF